ncbi:putative oxidoreductase [Chryseobacterium oranimense G311]|uniref:SDR family oxidoreductase n=1 Tax=Chryseobacterium oranimense TaxID=421058 RepID=UPI0005337F4F|nr:SDR family NAD(P)-dependent oxidoreductase [Chryseobacterium oranimense]CEJ68144.1 putative oxidoreductase [Chryseobacterium oranimense G311]
MEITNKTALVTGAGSGIGYEIAKLLIEKGNKVIIVGRNAEKINKAALELGAEALVCDISKDEEIENLAVKIKNEFPELSILVNNAGVAHLYKLGEGAEASQKAKQEFQVNYFGPVLLTERLLPLLKKQSEAAVINITSNVTFQPLIVLPTYSDAKAALHSHTVALRHTLGKDSTIKIYEVMPSLVNTEATKNMGGENGMHPSVVAESIFNGIKNDSYEIYVGDTAEQRNAYFENPAQSLETFNSGL